MSPQTIPVTQSKNGHATPRIAPAVDVYETADGVVVQADMPGCTPSSLSIQVEDETLTLEGKADFAAPTGLVERLVENRPVVYARSFRLRPDLDRAKIAATLKDGVLTLTIPRTAESKPRKIEVRVG